MTERYPITEKINTASASLEADSYRRSPRIKSAKKISELRAPDTRLSVTEHIPELPNEELSPEASIAKIAGAISDRQVRQQAHMGTAFVFEDVWKAAGVPEEDRTKQSDRLLGLTTRREIATAMFAANGALGVREPTKVNVLYTKGGIKNN